jgi:Bacterial type II secretion system protein F domain.
VGPIREGQSLSDNDDAKPIGVDFTDATDFAALAKSSREAIERVTAPTRELSETMRRLTENMVPKGLAETMAKISMPTINPGLTRISELIDDQSRTIQNLRLSQPSIEEMGLSQPLLEPFEFPELPPNPAFETNERLERIEQQFESMRTIAAQGAEIATSLQAYAAQFLSRFEQAANETDRSARKAVLVSITAVVLTVITAVVPIAYDLAWQSPANAAADAAAMAATEALQAELAGLRADQQALFERLETSLANADAGAVPVLEDLRDILRDLRPMPPDLPDQVPSEAPEAGVPAGDDIEP